MVKSGSSHSGALPKPLFEVPFVWVLLEKKVFDGLEIFDMFGLFFFYKYVVSMCQIVGFSELLRKVFEILNCEVDEW